MVCGFNINTEYWWLVVSIIDASLLCMIAAGNIPKYERSNRLIFLLIAAAFSNIGSSYMRFKRGNWLALVNSGILFIAGSLAFVGAFRVRQAIKEAEVQDTEEGNEGEGEAFIVEKIPV